MRKNSNNLIAGLDIGSSSIRMAVGQLVENANGGAELQILGAAEARSEGMHRGTMRSIEDVVSAISACYEGAERMIGVPIGSVWLGVSGSYILAQPSKGVVAVSKADNEISEDDVRRAVEAARTISTPLNYDVLHVLPRSYNVDGQIGIRDPIGMTGIRLEVDTQIILGLSAQIKNLQKAVNRTGLDIEDFVLSVLANAEVEVTQKQKEMGALVVDLGATTTSMAVFEDGDLLHTAVLEIGSENVTKDIALTLRAPVDVAERIKIEFGNCFSETVSKKEEIDLYDFGSPEHKVVKIKFLSEIIEARMEEILMKIDQELRKIQRSGLLPAGAVFAGAGAKMPGLIELGKKVLRLPVTLGYPLGVMSITDKVNDLGFVTAVGLVKWGSAMQQSSTRGMQGPRRSERGILGEIFRQLKKWLSFLAP